MTKKPDVPDANGKPDAQKSSPDAKPKRKGKDFGLEGSNKTIAVPQPDAQPADELQGTKSKFIPNTNPVS